jgi:hypothetical protein
MKQIKALSDQLVAMNIAISRCLQPTLCFVDEDDMITFNEVQSQRRKVRIDVWSLRWATFTVIREPQIHLKWRRKMNLLIKNSKETSLLMTSSNMEMLNMKMLKILHKELWIRILYQPMIPRSMIKIFF